ncbi:hypothetical protein [Pontibacter cellulosilyticus]|uniref:Uncharacterized protein n=1 Tax=Pontibacter cellulosilyticus TaxID=1720253 RepID=A0A923SL08_9BACT|nr:hypothetical protein [Pontibacter cellulosilyticus]MBC5994346.1 hypothetical protein [Pontibacter cellulosilyticus]
MKYLFLLVFLACVACNPDVKEETKKQTDSVEATTSSFSFMEDSSRIKKISGDSIRIFIADEEQNDSTLLPVSDSFYEQFIKNNSLFENKRYSADFSEGTNISHYYWGQIETPLDYKFLLISQREELDFAVNKVFLFVFDIHDKLMSITPVAELGYYPGAKDYRYSTLRSNSKLEFVSVQESITDEDDSEEGNPNYLVEKDSTTIKYAFRKGKFDRTYTDTVKTSYWTK